MPTLCRRYLISGRVQGVSYRAATRKQAISLQLTGWVRNLADGRVEALACGNETQLESFEAWLWKGPVLAHVDNVEVNVVAVDIHEDFSVKH